MAGKQRPSWAAFVTPIGPPDAGYRHDSPHVDPATHRIGSRAPRRHGAARVLDDQADGVVVDELITAARSAPLLRARLEQAAGTEPIVDVSGVLDRLDRVADVRGFVPYGEAASFAHGIRVELAAVETLRAEGFAAAAIEVLEHAITVIEGALGFVDDSDGEVGGVLDDAQELYGAGLHRGRARTRRAGQNDSPAGRCAATGRSSWIARARTPRHSASPGWPEFGRSWMTRPSVCRWAMMPTTSTVTTPTMTTPTMAGRPRSPSGTCRNSWPRKRGTDKLIDVLAQDLSTAYRFHRIATVLAADDRVEEALAWLERGRNTTFCTWHDDRLDDLAADLHRRAGRFAVETQMVAEGFAASPTVSGYERLRVFANDAVEWDRRQAEALEVLRAMPVAALPTPGRRSMAEASGHGVLVRVLIEEGDIDGAWAAAQQGGCPSPIWIEVAEARGVTHPADAVPVFQRLGANALEGGNRNSYAHGAALIRRAHHFAEPAGLTPESTAWIVDVREKNRRRPALQDEFNRHHLPKVR